MRNIQITVKNCHPKQPVYRKENRLKTHNHFKYEKLKSFPFVPPLYLYFQVLIDQRDQIWFGVDFDPFVLLFHEFLAEMPESFPLHAQIEKVLYELSAQTHYFFDFVFGLMNRKTVHVV